ncbi:uncharacterized protein BO96DRAFT_327066 [Aspergillus niger CBS 101883]|uniref:Uncharacterized protein n=2 Tax=Aspergillus niger TaxID=5061 RepID=A2R7E1_ASPNC|nr:uncharacterized protein BO96DRAFT_327066 [Aspergillus niger CBS 101883]XP_059602726.1 hypothetical protein An16g03200 [Aspergillus niger]PYH61623.1 hypothetical protein BO96DRAFT_327066 [Aspergillus niger CBS 101883]CAK42819.1 hypothetical protein An16g03200 [Aspergillus niger]
MERCHPLPQLEEQFLTRVWLEKSKKLADIKILFPGHKGFQAFSHSNSCLWVHTGRTMNTTILYSTNHGDISSTPRRKTATDILYFGGLCPGFSPSGRPWHNIKMEVHTHHTSITIPQCQSRSYSPLETTLFRSRHQGKPQTATNPTLSYHQPNQPTPPPAEAKERITKSKDTRTHTSLRLRTPWPRCQPTPAHHLPNSCHLHFRSSSTYKSSQPINAYEQNNQTSQHQDKLLGWKLLSHSQLQARSDHHTYDKEHCIACIIFPLCYGSTVS